MPKGIYPRKSEPMKDLAGNTQYDEVVEKTIDATPLRRPISEAPKDGTWIKLFSPEIKHGILGHWRKSRRLGGLRWVENCFWASVVNNQPLGTSWTEWEAWNE